MRSMVPMRVARIPWESRGREQSISAWISMPLLFMPSIIFLAAAVSGYFSKTSCPTSSPSAIISMYLWTAVP